MCTCRNCQAKHAFDGSVASSVVLQANVCFILTLYNAIILDISHTNQRWVSSGTACTNQRQREAGRKASTLTKVKVREARWTVSLTKGRDARWKVSLTKGGFSSGTAYTNQRQRCQTTGVTSLTKDRTDQRGGFHQGMHKPKAEREAGRKASTLTKVKVREARWQVSLHTNQRQRCQMDGRWVFIRDCVHKPKAERPDDRCHFTNQRSH